MEKIDWCFPPTGGGIEAGVNDAGIVTFDGAPLANLAREALQNSVDARDDRDRPVGVTFEIREIAVSEFGGPSLSEHVVACANEWESDTKARRVLDKAQNLLADSTLPMLGIIDTNTKGLAGTSWRGLVKVTGASFKLSESAGGSFGVGKAAPFTLSPLRTVCYWSLFREGSSLVERFQGKAVLLSHYFESGHGEEMTQATGFYGRVQGCEALDGPDVPGTFRPNKPYRHATDGDKRQTHADHRTLNARFMLSVVHVPNGFRVEIGSTPVEKVAKAVTVNPGENKNQHRKSERQPLWRIHKLLLGSERNDRRTVGVEPDPVHAQFPQPHR